jgi:1-acyl-sn-glycerol-3-phosphate acyltransferase
VFIIKMEMRRVFYFGKALEYQGHIFVERGSIESRHQARDGLMGALKDGDRVIVFPEGRASPGAKRLPFKPFSFAAVQRHEKLIQGCVIDYLPDRKMLEWDIKRPMFPQLVDLFGRHRTDVSIEFFPAEKVDDAREAADRYHDLIQGKLEEHDRERAEAAKTEEP